MKENVAWDAEVAEHGVEPPLRLDAMVPRYVAWQLKREQPTRPQDAHQFFEVPLDRRVARQVLEDDARVHPIERCIVEPTQVWRHVQFEAAVFAVAVERLCLLDHPRGDVDADHFVETRCQSARQSPGAAPEVERGPVRFWQTEVRCAGEDGVDLGTTAGEERIWRFFFESLVGIGKDRPVEIFGS